MTALAAALIPITTISVAYALATAWASLAEGQHWHLHHPRHARPHHRGTTR